MAQSNNAQREPSMEEILASIRRIIEDSDTTRRAGEAELDGTTAANAPGGEASNVHAFRLGLHEEADATLRLDGASTPSAPFDVPSERSADRLMGTSTSAPAGAPEPLRSSGAAPFPASQPTAFTDLDATLRRAPAPDAVDLSLDDFGADLGADASDADASGFGDTQPDPRPALMSDAPGRQVAASFGELSAAFEARSRRSLDSIAEEMMRPMLQDWLDNNLPHLVERLVREEIERIARGGPAPR